MQTYRNMTALVLGSIVLGAISPTGARADSAILLEECTSYPLQIGTWQGDLGGTNFTYLFEQSSAEAYQTIWTFGDGSSLDRSAARQPDQRGRAYFRFTDDNGRRFGEGFWVDLNTGVLRTFDDEGITLSPTIRNGANLDCLSE